MSVGKARFFSRNINCPKCGARVRVPMIWVVGVESIFVCKECGLRMFTGYKMGAILFGVSFTMALITANLLVYLLSSSTMPFVAIAVIPLWVLYGFVLRRWWLMYRTRKEVRGEGE